MRPPSPRTGPATPGPVVNILVVDDVPAKLLAMEALLSDLRENVVCVRSGADALRQLLEREFAVILLDVNMPDMDGFETAELIRRHPHVFGEESADTAGQVLHRWEEIKAEEKRAAESNGQPAETGLLGNVPRHQPAMLEAREISKKAARAGFEWRNADELVDKVGEEIEEFREARAVEDADRTEGREEGEGERHAGKVGGDAGKGQKRAADALRQAAEDDGRGHGKADQAAEKRRSDADLDGDPVGCEDRGREQAPDVLKCEAAICRLKGADHDLHRRQYQEQRHEGGEGHDAQPVKR